MLIVNLDTHRPLVLLHGRDQHTLATWFRKYPEIQVVSRDRCGINATAAREGAPQARQVAERWLLLNNIGDAPERMMYSHMGWTEAADLIVKGMEGAINAKTVTYDFERLMEGAKLLKCSEFGDAIIKNM